MQLEAERKLQSRHEHDVRWLIRCPDDGQLTCTRSNAATWALGRRLARSTSDTRSSGCAAVVDDPPWEPAAAYQESWLRKYRSMAAAISQERRPPPAPSTALDESSVLAVRGPRRPLPARGALVGFLMVSPHGVCVRH